MEILGKYLIIDTSVLVSMLIKEDTNHELAVKFIDGLTDKNIIILPPLSVFEIAVTLSKMNYDTDMIETKIISILKKFKTIVCQLNDLQFIKNLELLKNNKYIRTHDFYLLQTAIQFEVPIYTFDKKFVEHGSKIYKDIILL